MIPIASPIVHERRCPEVFLDSATYRSTSQQRRWSWARRLRWSAALAVGCAALAGQAARAQASVGFGSAVSPIATGQSSTKPVTVTATQAGSVNSVEFLTAGASGGDFAGAGTGCSGMNLSASQTCQVSVTFTPTAPGVRVGAVVLLDSNSNVLGTSYLYGFAQGALGVFVPGTMNTAAGSGYYHGYSGANSGVPALQAILNEPAAAVLDGAGNLYIADSGNNVIRKVTPSGGSLANGTITTIAGSGSAEYTGDNGPAASATLSNPQGLAIDGAGNLYIADTGNHVIREIAASTGTITTIAGTGSAGPATNGSALSVTFSSPTGLVLDTSGNVYVADTGNNVVREISGGTVTTVAGTGTGGNGGDGQAATLAELSGPTALAFDLNGNLYIADTGNNRVREVSGGTISNFAGNSAGTAGNNNGPLTTATFFGPSGLVFDPAGNLYIADEYNNVVRKVKGTGVLTVAGNGSGNTGSPGGSGAGDGGSATSASMYAPLGLALDSMGDLFIADSLGMRLREVASTPAVITFPNAVRNTEKSGAVDQNFENDGNGPLSISSIAADANAEIDPAQTTCSNSTTLQYDQACQIEAIFYPDENPGPTTTNQPLTANITLKDNAVNSNQVLELSGTVAPINSTTVTVQASPQTSILNNAITFTVTVTSGATTGIPTGNVTISLTNTSGGSPLSIGPFKLNSSGVATGQYTGLPVGQYNVVASYPGDGAHLSGDSSATPYTITVVPQVSLTLSSSNPTATFGSNVTITATFVGYTNLPSNPVVFTAGGQTYSENVGAGGTASFTTNALPVGTDTITATYAGDTYNPQISANPYTETINAVSTVTTVGISTPNPTYGTLVTLSATITPLPEGTGAETVTFYPGSAGGTCTGTPLGTATLTGSQAAFQTNLLPAGQDSVCAKYSGDSDDGSSVGVLAVTVTPFTPTVTVSGSVASPLLAGTAIDLTASMTGPQGLPPTGSVTFTANSNPLGTATLANGVAILHNVVLPLGSSTLTASYAAQPNYAAAAGSISYSVVQAQTSTVVTVPSTAAIAGNAVPLTATVTVKPAPGVNGTGGAPSGTVQFMSNNAPLGAPQTLVNGAVTFAAPAFDPGTYTITAEYLGVAADAADTSASVPLTVVQATTKITLASSSTNNTSYASQTVMFTATATNTNGPGVPGGNVTFFDGGTPIGTQALSTAGIATLSVSNLGVGSHNITAMFAGSVDDSSATSNIVIQTVSLIPTQVSLGTSLSTANTGQQVILASTVVDSASGLTPPSGGLVTFTTGSTVLGTGTVDGTGLATFSPTLNPGTYTIVAQYGGDSLHAGSTSAGITLTITPGNGFLLNMPSTISLQQTQNTTFTIGITSNDNFADTLAFGCEELPPGVTCSFSQPTVVLAANGTANVQLTVDTASPLSGGSQASLHSDNKSGMMLAGGFLPLSLFFGWLFWRGRKRNAAIFTAVLVLILTGATFVVTGCGGLNLTGAAPGTYTFQVVATGTNTKVSRAGTVTLTVTK